MKHNTATGFIVATFGRRYRVAVGNTLHAATASGNLIDCVSRGKKREATCGDQVTFTVTGDASGVIETIVTRSNIYRRADAFKEKMLAANITQVAIIVAGKPTFSDELLTRALCAAEEAGVRVQIVLNKIDLTDAATDARSALKPYSAMGYDILELAAKQGVASLFEHLRGQITLLIGQSGMGKSTILNALAPEAQARTREISEALNSGTHTTTSAQAYALSEESVIIDTPGFQEFGLSFMNRDALDLSFRDVRPHLSQCRFQNCKHGPEPGCALTAAVAAGSMTARRHALHQRIGQEIDYAQTAHFR